MKLSFMCFCQLAVFKAWLLDFSASDLQHAPGPPVQLWLFISILLHDPVGVWAGLACNDSWLPRCILFVLDPNCGIKSEVVFHTLFHECLEISVVFHFIFSCNNHVISNSCDTIHTYKDSIQFGLENVLCHNCTHGRWVHWNLANGKAMQVSFLESG